MNKPISRLFLVALLMFGALLVSTSWWTVLRADDLDHDTANHRELIRAPEDPARDDLRRRRLGRSRARRATTRASTTARYPQGKRFGHPVGYSYASIGQSGLERVPQRRADRRSRTRSRRPSTQLVGKAREGDDVRTTLDPKAQQIALDEIAAGRPQRRRGRAGPADGRGQGDGLDADLRPQHDRRRRASSPRPTRTTRTRRWSTARVQFGAAPGSTFKVVTSTAAIDSGQFTPSSTRRRRQRPEDLRRPAGQRLQRGLRADHARRRAGQVGQHRVRQRRREARQGDHEGVHGALRLRRQARARLPQGHHVGLGRRAQPAGPRGLADVALRRRRAHGDRPGRPAGARRCRWPRSPPRWPTAGRLMKPPSTTRFVDRDGRTVDTIAPALQSTVMKPSTAAAVTDMMVAVVQRGTGTKAAIPGHPGRGQDRHGRDRVRHQDQRRVVHRLRARREPAHRGRGHRQGRHRLRRRLRRADRPRHHARAAQVTDVPDTSTIIDGRYRVLHRVGSGGMADVVCAEDLQLGRKVAIKLLHRRFAQDEEFVERFRREASSAAGLQHPHVVAVYDRGAWDDTYYIAMEYLEGRTLKKLVQDEAPLARAAGDRPDDPDPARRALRPQARDHPPRPQAPQRHHRRRGPREGHRLRDRQGRRVGHDADRLDHGHRAVPLARAGPGPRGQRAVDLYSVGIILYEMLTGRVPFEGESAVTIALKQVSEAPVPPSQLQPGRCRRRWRPSCCARWRRTRRGASPTPTSSSPRWSTPAKASPPPPATAATQRPAGHRPDDPDPAAGRLPGGRPGRAALLRAARAAGRRRPRRRRRPRALVGRAAGRPARRGRDRRRAAADRQGQGPGAQRRRQPAGRVRDPAQAQGPLDRRDDEGEPDPAQGHGHRPGPGRRLARAEGLGRRPHRLGRSGHGARARPRRARAQRGAQAARPTSASTSPRSGRPATRSPRTA